MGVLSVRCACVCALPLPFLMTKISAISHAVPAAFLAAHGIPASARIVRGSPSRTDTPHRSRPRSPAEAAAWPAGAAELVPPGPPHSSSDCHAGQRRPANLHQTVAKRRWVWLERKVPPGGGFMRFMEGGGTKAGASGRVMVAAGEQRTRLVPQVRVLHSQPALLTQRCCFNEGKYRACARCAPV